MSYNIDTWKTKALDNFRIPLDALYEISEDMRDRGWELDPPKLAPLGEEIATDDYPPDRHRFGAVGSCMDPDAQAILISVDDGGYIGGVLTDGVLWIEHIELHGEGSGTRWHDHIAPALAQSRGTLIAVRVWEGGDTIDRVTVRDGVVTEEDIEL